MSIIYCENCDQWIDTDYDVEHQEECLPKWEDATIEEKIEIMKLIKVI